MTCTLHLVSAGSLLDGLPDGLPAAPSRVGKAVPLCWIDSINNCSLPVPRVNRDRMTRDQRCGWATMVLEEPRLAAMLLYHW